jgi:hypothetical protein
MPMTMIPLLLHHEDVPDAAREALAAAGRAAPDSRAAQLERAASALFRETELECAEARELVGLPRAGSCAE